MSLIKSDLDKFANKFNTLFSDSRMLFLTLKSLEICVRTAKAPECYESVTDLLATQMNSMVSGFSIIWFL